MEIELPFNFSFRDYQLDLQHAFYDMLEGKPGAVKRFYYIWHRRCGKDLTALHLTCVATQHRVGTYWHLLPQQEQVRKAIWEGMTKDGRRFLDVFPGALNPDMPGSIVESVNNSEMKIKFKNGSVWYAMGSDGYQNRLGTNPVGVTFSEYAYSDPLAWQAIEPILIENEGWAIKETTPEGENHAKIEWDAAQKSPRWWTQMLTILDTNIISEERIDELREDGTDEDTIQKYYYCSFKASVKGAYFSLQLQAAKEGNRITCLPIDINYPVHTFWDIGKSDYTSIWFVQMVGSSIRLVDYYQNCGRDAEHYMEQLEDRNYRYGNHYLPHDAKNKRYEGQVLNIHRKMKPNWSWETIKRTPSKNLSIANARMILNRCWFDESSCSAGLNALRSYTKKYDEKRKMFLNEPHHNWASHGADAFLAIADFYSHEYNLTPEPEEQLHDMLDVVKKISLGKKSGGSSKRI